jgi:selenocysteine-specific elongation factor
VIIGTAGHIDHGKTSLVKALTGVDADRLKEEKERGITVDLGFAYKPLPDGDVLGFVDVPGHEKLVRNMLAGATGIDHVLLVVAADDGPMPQTREHLAILDLLGLREGVVALTKCDLVSPERLAEAETEVRLLLAGTGLAGAPILPVSVRQRPGHRRELEQHLVESRNSAGRAAPRGWHFRLAVDRSFTLAGIGTVVTGTAVSGRVAVGDRLLSRRVGRRCACAVSMPRTAAGEGRARAATGAGAGRRRKGRGPARRLGAAAALHAPTRAHRRAAAACWPAKPRRWPTGRHVHLHLGAEDVGAVSCCSNRSHRAWPPDARVQLDLDRPIGALRGDRFIVRDQSALRTLGGGVVIDALRPTLAGAARSAWPRWRPSRSRPPREALAACWRWSRRPGIDRCRSRRCGTCPTTNGRRCWRRCRTARSATAAASCCSHRARSSATARP